MRNFNENWDGVVRKNVLNEKYYATGKATDKLQIIPAKWVYEKFFARLKAKGENFLFNQKVAEEELEWVIALMHDPKSQLGKWGIRSHGRDYRDAFDYAEKRYMSRMGLDR